MTMILTMSTRLDWWSSTDLTQDTPHIGWIYRTHTGIARRVPAAGGIAEIYGSFSRLTSRQPGRAAAALQVVSAREHGIRKSVSKLPPESRIYSV